ncbi:MAG: hypothetical protein WC132_03905 [Methanomethylophilus sp.]
MNRKLLAVAVVAVLFVSGIGIYYVTDNHGSDAEEKGTSGTTITDYAEREVVVPDNLDNGIVTVGRLSTLRWLAYFPEAMEHVIMIDKGIQSSASSGAGGLGYSYAAAYHSLLVNCQTHTNDSLTSADMETIHNLNPSLVLVNDSTYNSYKEAVDTLAGYVTVVVIDSMQNAESVAFWDSDYQLNERFTSQANLYGSILNMTARAEAVVGEFNAVLSEIHGLSSGDTTCVAYTAGCTHKGCNPLNCTFPAYIPLLLTNITNAAASRSSSTDQMITLDAEDFTTLSFNTVVVDPSSMNVIGLKDSQLVLEYLYRLNNDDNNTNDVSILVTIPEISHGANWDCALASAYFMAYSMYNTGLTATQLLEKINAMFDFFYGEDCGVVSSMQEYYTELSSSTGQTLNLFTAADIVNTDGVYSLVSES